MSKIGKVIGVVSGKGGVGKSLVSSLLSIELNRRGHNVGILDADITGPSIPKAFGVKGPAEGEDGLIYPVESRTGIKIMSANLLLENEDDPIIWRGPLLGNLVKQFYEDVLWEELDYLLIDMPPGTGDVALSVFQLLPVDDLIIVTSPQDLVSLIVSKALKMASMMNIHVLGVVENMSYVLCPDCKTKIKIYGESNIHQFAKQMNFEVLGQLPIIPGNSNKVDDGKVETIVLDEIVEIAKKL
jgi:Mrp family chromosome partitioning ATPase